MRWIAPSLPFRRRAAAVGLLGALIWLAGCGEDKPLTRFVNSAPRVNALTATPDTLGLGDTAQVACDVEDPDLDVLRYRWSASSGRFLSRDPRLSTVYWVAPEAEGPASVSVTVDDGVDSVASRVDLLVMGPSGILAGMVVDEDLETPLADVRLELAGRVATSGADGRYRIPFLPLGVDTLTASLSGYHPWSQIVSVREGLDTVDVRLDRIELVTRLFGVVRDRRQLPVAGAVCRAGTVETTTDAAGAYEFAAVAQGRQVLQVRAAGYVTLRDTLEVAGEEMRRDLLLQVAIPERPAGQLRATRQAGLAIEVRWTPEAENTTLIGYDLLASVDEGASVRVAGVRFPRLGGTRTFSGVEHGRYRFSVVPVNFDEQSGVPSAPSPVVVLTYPTPTATIDGGALVMGNYPDGWGNQTHPGNPVEAPGSVRLETHEVTNRQYLAFLLEGLERGDFVVTATEVQAAGQPLVLFAGSKIDPDPLRGLAVPAELVNHPVAGVTWAGADAYARSIGRRLPTEAEWELAARGRSNEHGTWPGSALGVGTIYPWGNAPPDQTRANFGGSFNTTRAVGSYPGGVIEWGGVVVHDLAGNVDEWCADWFAPYASPHQPPASGTYRVVRGGNYASGSLASAPELRAAHRTSQLPTAASPRTGFRCAE